jgi:hypothetical protein
MDVGVSVAIITGIFSVLVTLIQKARKENRSDHNMVYESLQDIKTDVRDVGTKLDNHIDWHLKK